MMEVKVMVSTNITIRTDNELKTKAQNVLNELGIDMPTAINFYLRQIVNENGIPFELNAEKQQSLPKLGGWEGDIWMANDFDAPMEEFKEYM